MEQMLDPVGRYSVQEVGTPTYRPHRRISIYFVIQPMIEYFHLKDLLADNSPLVSKQIFHMEIFNHWPKNKR